MMINTEFLLQEEIIKSMNNLFKDTFYETCEGNRKINVYGQYLPAKTVDKTIYPLIQVTIVEGKVKIYDKKTTNIGIIVGNFDTDKEFTGYKNLMNMVEKIKQFFEKNIVFGAFEIEELDWNLSDENLYPYFIAGIEIKFKNVNNNLHEEFC